MNYSNPEFEAEAERYRHVVPPTTRPGRNQACWCGSGKKYKRCHLRIDEALSELPKMSDILEILLEPLVQGIPPTDHEAIDTCLKVAAAGWNLSRLPAERWNEMLRGAPADLGKGPMREMIEEVADRARAMFPHDRRMVTDTWIVSNANGSLDIRTVFLAPNAR